jgi:hypothetical protein
MRRSGGREHQIKRVLGAGMNDNKRYSTLKCVSSKLLRSSLFKSEAKDNAFNVLVPQTSLVIPQTPN